MSRDAIKQIAAINAETKLCISLSARPGNFGNRFHNYLYNAYNLNYIYKSCDTQDIEAAIAGVKALNIRGCAVSMPFKVSAMAFVDSMSEEAKGIGSINTIVNKDGFLKAYNTDFFAVKTAFSGALVEPSLSVALLGNGGMAKAVAHALHSLGFSDTTIISRNKERGISLADKYGFKWKSYDQDLGREYDFLINATPIGMEDEDFREIVFSDLQIKRARVICDVVTVPAPTGLIKTALDLGKKIITGVDLTMLQAAEQFRLYTGITASKEMIDSALEFYRQRDSF